MPRYFFHIRDNDGLIPDEEGQDLPDLDAARREAQLSARDLLEEKLQNGEPHNGATVEVTDEAGSWLEAVPFASVAAPQTKH